MTWREASLDTAIAVAISMAFSPFSLPACAQAVGPSPSVRDFSVGPRFAERSGEELFANICQACHMPDGKGATGAGAYPSLAGNNRLETGGYPVAVVINGQRGMPPFGGMLSDEQVAAVVNYVRTHFGNSYYDAVTVEEIQAFRR
jgi:mono/diheme cytochrome c family protein